jgi:hypothetical protein
MRRKGLVLIMSFVILLVFSTTNAQAGGCRNPVLLPFAIAGAVVGTVAAITTAVLPPPSPAYPGYGGPVYQAPPPVYYGPPAGYYGPPTVRYNAGPYWNHNHRAGYWGHDHWR